MTTAGHIMLSLENMFLSEKNIIYLSAQLRRNAKDEMKAWALKQDLDDNESVSMDYIEALDFVNAKFLKKFKEIPVYLSGENGNKYPKAFVEDSFDKYNHIYEMNMNPIDAQFTQVVQRSNANFRYGNKIKSWQTHIHKRNYDRNYHAEGLRDTRELNNLVRGYNMEKIYGPNEFESSDSKMYSYGEFI